MSGKDRVGVVPDGPIGRAGCMLAVLARRRLTMAVAKPDPIVQHVIVRADLINVLHWPVGAVMSQGMPTMARFGVLY